MIAEVFLICALTPTPVVAFAPVAFSQAATKTHYEVIQSVGFVMRRKKDQERGLLLIGGNPTLVHYFRGLGHRAFGALVDDFPGATPYHAVTNADALSFKSGQFNAVYVLNNNPMQEACLVALKESIRLVAPSGYLIVSDHDFPDWGILLALWKWERMPIVFNGFGVWKRSVDPLSTSFYYRDSMRRIQSHVIPFKQKWAMRQILASA